MEIVKLNKIEKKFFCANMLHCPYTHSYDDVLQKWNLPYDVSKVLVDGRRGTRLFKDLTWNLT